MVSVVLFLVREEATKEWQTNLSGIHPGPRLHEVHLRMLVYGCQRVLRSAPRSSLGALCALFIYVVFTEELLGENSMTTGGHVDSLEVM
jgi:hypothetical protein